MARIELLDSHHDRRGFACGTQALDDFLSRFAGQQQRRGLGKTYVAVAENGASVQGFITVSVGQIATGQLPTGLKLPRYPIPILRIGRLAVNKAQQGQGIGRDLLAFALDLAVGFSHRVGLYAVVVDAKDEIAAAWYARLGFQACMDQPLCLYLPIATLAAARPAD